MSSDPALGHSSKHLLVIDRDCNGGRDDLSFQFFYDQGVSGMGVSRNMLSFLSVECGGGGGSSLSKLMGPSLGKMI